MNVYITMYVYVYVCMYECVIKLYNSHSLSLSFSLVLFLFPYLDNLLSTLDSNQINGSCGAGCHKIWQNLFGIYIVYYTIHPCRKKM